MRMNSRTRLAVLVVLVIVALAAAGCSSLPWSKKPPLTVADPNGVFHVKTPGDWRANVEAGLIGLYASEQLPTAETFDALSILIFSGEAAEKPKPESETLTTMVKKRAEQKKWQKPTYGKPAKTKLGKRDAWVMEVKAIDSKGRAFTGAYYFARTNGKEFFVVAVSPSDSWNADKKKVAGVTKEWYWHQPEVAKEATPAAKPVTKTK